MSGDFPAVDEILARVAPGKVVAGYQIEQQIGEGGMAVVFRAYDEQLRRRIALKFLAPALARDAEFRARFMREARASAVEHPHVIPVYAADEADGILFIAMRLVSGGDLRSLVNRGGPLPPGRVAEIISAIASALDAAHAAGRVHRDVKPANILFDPSGHVYLSDFGLSKGIASASDVTQAGQLLGTPDYMAPEQIEGKVLDGRADQYALAGVAVHLLTGHPPYQRELQEAVLAAHLYAGPPAVHPERDDVPPAVDEVIARAMAKAPGRRYGSCGEFADELRAALGPAAAPAAAVDPGGSQAGVVTSIVVPPPAQSAPESIGPPGGRPRWRRRLALSMAATAAVAAVAVTAVVLLHPAHPGAGPSTHPSATSGRAAGPHDSGRLTDSVSGLTYPLLSSPWKAGCPPVMSGKTFTWTAGEAARVGSVAYAQSQVPWYGQACSGVLPQKYAYSDVASLQATTMSLEAAFDAPYYGALRHQRTQLSSAAITVSGHRAWELKFLESYIDAAGLDLAWNGEEAAIVVIDRGSGTRPAVLFVSIPDSLQTTDVDLLVSSLRLAGG